MSREDKEAETRRLELAYDYLDLIFVRDKELNDRSGDFDRYVQEVGSAGLAALEEHGWRVARQEDGWREYLTGGNDLGPPGKRTGYLDLIIHAHRHARNYTGMGRWLQRRGEMLYGHGIGLTPTGVSLGDNDFGVSCNKINHDLAQLDFLEESGLISSAKAGDARQRLSTFLSVIEPMIGCDETEYRSFPKMKQVRSYILRVVRSYIPKLVNKIVDCNATTKMHRWSPLRR